MEKSWKENNTIHRYTENIVNDEISFAKIENKVSKAIKHNSDFLAYIFSEQIEDYIYDNYTPEEIDNLNFNDLIHDWFDEKYNY